MTTSDTNCADLHTAYDIWCSNRAAVAERESNGAQINPEVWADLGDAATDLMHRLADTYLFPRMSTRTERELLAIADQQEDHRTMPPTETGPELLDDITCVAEQLRRPITYRSLP